MMKKIMIALVATMWLGTVWAQQEEEPTAPMTFDTVGADTTRAIAVIDRYIGMVDFSQRKTDSVFCVVSYAIDRSHPNDTITIYRWYMSPFYNRIEIWQGGKMQDGFHSDGVKLFRKFHTGRREWATLTPESYYRITLPLDIRGALYNWRKKGGEVFYAGEVTYQGKKLDRVFVTMPNTFDRYYYFERETGVLGLLVEDEHIFGDGKKAHNAVRVDWKAWHEFVPFGGFFMPKEESYQVDNNQVVILHHAYHYEAPNLKLFTEDYTQNR